MHRKEKVIQVVEIELFLTFSIDFEDFLFHVIIFGIIDLNRSVFGLVHPVHNIWIKFKNITLSPLKSLFKIYFIRL